MSATKSFFKEALEMSGDAPDRVRTDKEVAYPLVIREELGGDVLHRTNQYLNNLIEQDHRGIKQRYGPMKGFKSFESASRFCRAHDELRSYYKAGQRGEKVSLKQQRISDLNKTLDLTDSVRLNS
jgi:putative transposase